MKQSVRDSGELQIDFFFQSTFSTPATANPTSFWVCCNISPVPGNKIICQKSHIFFREYFSKSRKLYNFRSFWNISNIFRLSPNIWKFVSKYQKYSKSTIFLTFNNLLFKKVTFNPEFYFSDIKKGDKMKPCSQMVGKIFNMCL